MLFVSWDYFCSALSMTNEAVIKYMAPRHLLLKTSAVAIIDRQVDDQYIAVSLENKADKIRAIIFFISHSGLFNKCGKNKYWVTYILYVLRYYVLRFVATYLLWFVMLMLVWVFVISVISPAIIYPFYSFMQCSFLSTKSLINIMWGTATH